MFSVLGLFDRAYVINRDEDTDRMTLTSHRLAKVGIPFQRFPAKCFAERGNYRWAGMRGANASHLAIVQEAACQGLASVLIMEDDVIFRDNFCELWSKIVNKLATTDYDIFYGYNWRNKSRYCTDIDVIPIESTLCVHFWVIKSSFYNTFKEVTLKNDSTLRPKCIDTLFTNQLARIYAPTYNLVGQDQGISTVMGNGPRKLRWSA
jgi:hypothetical protein